MNEEVNNSEPKVAQGEEKVADLSYDPASQPQPGDVADPVAYQQAIADGRIAEIAPGSAQGTPSAASTVSGDGDGDDDDAPLPLYELDWKTKKVGVVDHGVEFEYMVRAPQPVHEEQ